MNLVRVSPVCGDDMTRLIPERESLTVEFKSDRDKLADQELVAAVICLANTDGGDLYVGVEDDGRGTGIHPSRRNVAGLTAMIANKTVPPVTVRVEIIDAEGQAVVRVGVSNSRQLVGTSEGLLQRRRIKADGSPECIPFYPHEFAGRQSDLGLLDYSALPVGDAQVEDLDPLERERLRQFVDRYGGDRSLVGLSDHELDGALGLVSADADRPRPTVAGLLLLGRESALRRHLPTHEVAFQVLEGTAVRVNDFYRTPLLRTFAHVDELFNARVVEEELEMDLFRVPVPNFDRRAFREAFVNASCCGSYAASTRVAWLERSSAMKTRLGSCWSDLLKPGSSRRTASRKDALTRSAPRSTRRWDKRRITCARRASTQFSKNRWC